MFVIQMTGRYSGETIDLPYVIALDAVRNGRAKPIPGDEWRFGLDDKSNIETAMINVSDGERETLTLGRRRGRPRKNGA